MEELMSILEEIRPDVDFENEKFLVKDGILESFDIISIVGALNDEYDIEIRPVDLIPENFNSAEAMLAMIKRLQDE
jgi:acyl carrier protein